MWIIPPQVMRYYGWIERHCTACETKSESIRCDRCGRTGFEIAQERKEQNDDGSQRNT